MSDLDTILSGREPAPGNEAVSQDTAEHQEIDAQQDDSQGEHQEAEGANDAPKQKMVPQEALHAEKQKVKRYTEQVASFEQTLKERDAAWERRLAQLTDALQPKPAQQVPDQFEDFDGAVNYRVQPQIQQAIDPIRHALMANARLVAENLHKDKFEPAIQAFDAAVAANAIDPQDARKIYDSPNPFHAAVLWHQRKIAQDEIGDDPAAYRERVRAELMAELQQTQPAEQTQQKPPVMPSNLATARNVGARSGPAWAGPPALTDIFKR